MDTDTPLHVGSLDAIPTVRRVKFNMPPEIAIAMGADGQNLSGPTENRSSTEQISTTIVDVTPPQAGNGIKNLNPLEATFNPPPQQPGKKRRRLSLSHREFPPPEAPTDLKSSIPQILACMAVSSFNIPEGMALSYSSPLIPQLSREDSDVKITFQQGVLLGSMMVVTMGLGAPLAGVVMNRFGRVNAVRMSLIPYIVGWILVATAVNFEMILIGRLFTGLAIALGVSSACVYNTEVAGAHVRGALNASCPTQASLGVLITYILGAYVNWRTHAWISAASPIVTAVAMHQFSWESPIWLVSKGRYQDAEKSLRALARCNDSHETREILPERQLAWLIQRHKYAESALEKKEPWYVAVIDLFRLPIGYKPLIILTLVFFAQNFAGVYITLFFAEPFFEKMGSSIGSQAAIYIGLTRFLVGMIAVMLIRNIGVRPLMIVSSLGMALCMGVSGYMTMATDHGLGEVLPVVMVLLFVAFSCIGLLSIPWTMTAELYSDQLRDAGQAVTILLAYLLMFLGLQLYPFLQSFAGGAGQLQLFFASVALANVVIVLIFLPETHGKSLQQIEEHFEHNLVWICRKQHVKDVSGSSANSVPPITVSVVPLAAGGA